MTPGEHYRGQRLALTELFEDLPANSLAWPVPGCPQWQVRDVLAHLVGETVAIRTGDLADAGSPAWTQRQVDARVDASVEELLAEWDVEGPPFEESLADKGFLGWVFCYDVTMHGDDVREALGLPLGASDTHAMVLDGIIDRARKRAVGLGTLTIRSGEQTWTVGEGAPSATLTVDDRGQLARVVGGRRTDDEVSQLDWTGDPTPWLPALPLFHHSR